MKTSLDDISRDHTFISYRKLLSEAQLCFNNLIEQMASSHISSLNLVTVVSCVYNIARQRPENFPQVFFAFLSVAFCFILFWSNQNIESLKCVNLFLDLHKSAL